MSDNTLKRDDKVDLAEFIKTVVQLDQIGLILMQSNADTLLAREKMERSRQRKENSNNDILFV